MNDTRDVIETPRLVLRPFVQADLPALAQLYADPLVMHYITGVPRSYAETHERLEHYMADQVRYGFGLCAAILKTTGQLIGRVGIVPAPRAAMLEGELAWMFLPAYWGQGLATESARALVTYGWQHLSIHRMFATADKGNVASIRLMQRLNMQFVREYVRSETALGVEYELWPL